MHGEILHESMKLCQWTASSVQDKTPYLCLRLGFVEQVLHKPNYTGSTPSAVLPLTLLILQNVGALFPLWSHRDTNWPC